MLGLRAFSQADALSGQKKVVDARGMLSAELFVRYENKKARS